LLVAESRSRNTSYVPCSIMGLLVDS
jgi:hypothetical protein